MAAGRYRFGLFALDTAKLELRREGQLLRLQAQPAQVLACLVERAGEVVSREELRKAVWGDTTFVDFEAGLNFCISQIRSALRDDSAQPLYIRTVPKSGYQFVAPVEQIAPEGDGAPRSARSETRSSDAAKRDAAPTSRKAKVAVWFAVVAIVLIVGAVGGLAFLMFLYLTPGSARYTPVLAVARFDNDTGDAALDRFTDGLTDNVVEQLTARSSGSYRVIGNAQILRVPREQRDLRAIGAALGAGYVVLGQVQASGGQLRILAHLIRLSDQTHIWVVRQDRARGDELRLEAELAAQISEEFAARMAQQPEKAPSFAPGSH